MSTYVLLAGACDLASEVPTIRWSGSDVASLSLQSIDADRVRFGCFLIGAELFDHACFAVPAGEASVIDPQQRILLGQSLQALGLETGQVQEIRPTGEIGAYLGAWTGDYADIVRDSSSAHSVFFKKKRGISRILSLCDKLVTKLSRGLERKKLLSHPCNDGNGRNFCHTAVYILWQLT